MHKKFLAAALASAAILVVGGVANAADVLGARPAVRAIPAPAPTFSGEAEIYAGWGGYDYGDDFTVFGGAARATFWLAPNFSTQIDANFDTLKYNVGSSWNIGSVVGHINMRNDAYLLGIYGGVANLDGDRAGLIGFEGQLYYGAFTFEARGGWVGDVDNNDNFSGAQFRAAARYFIDPNTMFEINGGFQALRYDVNTWNIGAVAEHKFGMAPVSIFASVDYANSDFKGGWSKTTGKIGAKVLFNQPTLRSADQTGSSLGKGFDVQLRAIN